jgi:hypothetical protein
MIRVRRLFEPEITRVAGSTPIVRFTVKCCLCSKTPKSGLYQASKVLPDLAVSNKFKQRGWLIAKTRDADVCPGCLKGAKVEDKNLLASAFKVTDEDGPVPSAEELADELKAEAARKRKATMGILDRHFGEQAPSDRSLVPPKAKKAASVVDTDQSDPAVLERFRTIVANDIQEIRAAVELIAEQNGMRTEMLRQQNEGHARHLEYFARLIETQERNNALLDQLIRAVAINTSEVAPIPQAVAMASRDVVSAIREHAESVVPALAKVPKAIVKRCPGPAAAQPVESVDEPAPSPALEAQPRLKRKSASVSVYSCPKRQPGKFYTSISVPRALWESVGFTEQDRYTIDVDDDMKITIARATEGGVKPKKIGREVVVFQTTRLGDLTTRRLFVKACDGIIRI